MNYYFPYYEKYNINYIYLLLFYKLAEADKNLWIKNTVKYSSLKDLTKRMNDLFNQIRKETDDTAQEEQIISQSTISRISSNTEYSSSGRKMKKGSFFSMISGIPPIGQRYRLYALMIMSFRFLLNRMITYLLPTIYI